MVGFFDESIHSLCAFLNEVVILLDLALNHIVNVISHLVHLSQNLLVGLVELLIDIRVLVEISGNILDSRGHVLIHSLDVQLLVVQSLVYSKLSSLILIFELLHSLVHICHIDLQVLILISLGSNLIRDCLACSLFEKINFILQLLDRVFKFLQAFLMSWEIEVM